MPKILSTVSYGVKLRLYAVGNKSIVRINGGMFRNKTPGHYREASKLMCKTFIDQ
jgi:hypothetical protein